MADIGEKLRNAREEKGLTIADIEKATKIQSRYLTAIEQNDFEKLPGDFYVRAFIRQYAQIVGLDGKELLSEYHQDIPEAKPDEYVENSIDNKSKEVQETTNNKKNLWKNYLPRIAVGLGVIIVLLVVYVLYAHLSTSSQNNNADSNVTVSSQKSSSKKKANPVVKKKKSSVKIAKITDNQYQVTGLKKNRTLEVKTGSQAINVSIAINGTVQFQQTMTANQKHSVVLPDDANTVVVTLGNDNGTSIKIGGKKVPFAPIGNYRSITLVIGNTTQNNTSTSSTTNGTSSTTQSSSQTSSSTAQSSSQASSQAQSSQSQSSQATSSSENTSSSQSSN